MTIYVTGALPDPTDKIEIDLRGEILLCLSYPRPSWCPSSLPPRASPVDVGGGVIIIAAVSGAVRGGLRDVCVAAAFYKLCEASPLGRSKLIGFGGMGMAWIGADLSGQPGLDTYTGEVFVTDDVHFLVGLSLGVSTSAILSASDGSASDFQGLAEDLTAGLGGGAGVVAGISGDLTTPDHENVRESTYGTINLQLGVGSPGVGGYVGKGFSKGKIVGNLYSPCNVFQASTSK